MIGRLQESVARGLKYTAVAALVFQIIHFVEHIAQLGYWLIHPADAPWVTPWATQARNALAVNGQVSLGNELLHLGGNLVFLIGLIALAVYLSRQRAERPSQLRTATWVQGIHVGEHIALTVSTMISGTAIGLSTFLGAVSGPVMTSTRVWFHFLINLIATWYAIQAVFAIYRRGLLVQPNRGIQLARST